MNYVLTYPPTLQNKKLSCSCYNLATFCDSRIAKSSPLAQYLVLELTFMFSIQLKTTVNNTPSKQV